MTHKSHIIGSVQTCNSIDNSLKLGIFSALPHIWCFVSDTFYPNNFIYIYGLHFVVLWYLSILHIVYNCPSVHEATCSSSHYKMYLTRIFKHCFCLSENTAVSQSKGRLETSWQYQFLTIWILNMDVLKRQATVDLINGSKTELPALCSLYCMYHLSPRDPFTKID